MNKKTVDAVWDKAKPIPGEDPGKYRQDPYGNKIRRDAYGKGTQQGWDIDHIKPVAKGGSDAMQNLQALQKKTNREKGDSLKKRSRHNQP